MFKIKFFLLFGILILGLAGYGYFKSIPVPENQESLPRIEIIPKTFDFGKAQYGDILEHAFKVKNTGKEVLEIKRVATSCSCTTAKIDKDKLDPGQTAELKVVYDTGAMGGAHGKGGQERIIYVKSSDPVSPQAEVIIYADVQ